MPKYITRIQVHDCLGEPDRFRAILTWRAGIGGLRNVRAQITGATSLKRAFDILVSSFLLVILLPVLVAIGCVVLVSLGWPVLFVQTRPGLHGNGFNLYKFRTMRSPSRNQPLLLSDSERLTRVGRVLRATSLDELPELVNVVKGDMSMVGPRPLLMEYLDRYSRTQARRHDVRPGITGLAQISGRNRLSWEEKFALDVWYVRHHSMLLDLKILLCTAVTVFRREGISADGHSTAPIFLGTNEKEEA